MACNGDIDGAVAASPAALEGIQDLGAARGLSDRPMEDPDAIVHLLGI